MTSSDTHFPPKIAVFLPNWLGDVVMATPVLRALREHFGQDAWIVGIMRPYLHDVLQGTDWLSQQWHYHPRSNDRRLRRAMLVRRLRAARFDKAVLMSHSFSTAAVAWLGGVRDRIGYVRYGRGPLLSTRLYPPRQGRRIQAEPMVDYYARLAEAAGCGPVSRKLHLATTNVDRRMAERVWASLGLSADNRVVAMNCSGAYGGAKLWPVEHFGQLARRVVEQLDHDVLVMCGPNEREIARDVVAHAGGGQVVSMADQPMDLGTAKACLQRTRLMVSTDSGPRHMAAALDVPVVTLFGPMLPIWSDNPTQRAIHLHLDLDCIGCHRRVCPLEHHRCMRDLSVDRVFDAVVRLMDDRDATTAAA